MYRYPRPNVYLPPPVNKNNYHTSNTIKEDTKISESDSKKKNKHPSEKPIFTIYGINLYSDDLLILLLLFFLYKENINDTLLLLALFSLLF